MNDPRFIPFDIRHWVARTVRRLAFVLPLLLLPLAGCEEDIETTYGQRHAPGAAWSVNGTAVLAEMFEQAGHQVSSRTVLTPRLREKADCIVWFPDSFDAPSPAVCRWLQDWLFDRSGRTLIYVGRDYDAAIAYWEAVLPGAPASQTAEIQRRLNEAKLRFQGEKALTAGNAECDFFSLEGTPPLRRVTSLQGDPQWTDGIDPAKADIRVSGRLVPSWGADVLLSSDDDALVASYPWYGSRVILVANGSFLVNFGLVNHEHRKLAGRLIDEVGREEQYVVFLESGPEGPAIRDEEPPVQVATGMDFFHEYPANWILMQLSIVGILFCLWRMPIFGRPLQPETDDATDFGRHIDALANLLRQSRDRAYALSRIHQQQQRKEESTR